ncbi:MAG: VTT domain-containing protein, partial [Steroidobacteraceae bacterium]
MKLRSALPRLLLLALIGAAIAAFFVFDLHRYLNLQTLKEQQHVLQTWRDIHPWLLPGAFFAIYVLVAALSLPGAAILTLAGGAIFGVFEGTILVSFASTLGATLAMLSSRFILRDWVRRRFGARFKRIDEGIAREGGFYLFSIRLVPAFPFFVI